MAAENVFFTNDVIIAANCDGFVRKAWERKNCSEGYAARPQKRPEGLGDRVRGCKRKGAGQLLLSGLSAQHFFDLQVNGAFQTFLLQSAAHLIRLLQTAAIAKIIGMAAAAAVEAGPALHASWLG